MQRKCGLLRTKRAGEPKVILAAVVYGHVLGGWQSRLRCFLDKCSVDQTDIHAKMEGIRNIGAFLKHSESMVVCWDESYFPPPQPTGRD